MISLIPSVSEQIYIFLATLYGGIVIGFIYDLYRIIRCIFRPKKLATFIQDFIFWLVISVAAMMVLLFSNDGEIRFYTFLGFVVGVLLYNRFLSKFVISILVRMIQIIRKILYMVIKTILYPLKIFLNFLKGPWYWMKGKLRPVYRRFKRFKKLPKRLLQEVKKYMELLVKKK